MRSRQGILALVLVLPVLGACGGPEAIDPASAESLQQQVRELATVTQEGNYELALDQAEALKAEVQRAQDSGAVTPGRAQRIQTNIVAFMESITPAQAPATDAPAAPSPVPSPIPTFTAPAKNAKEDSRDAGQSASDAERENAEEAAEEARERAEDAAEEAEKEAEKLQKQQEKNREGENN